jgi:serine phosphatase RsbU (regulator of sigma subunit)
MVENRLTKISGSALPIGIVDNITSYDYSFKLKAGDSIIMFSDGIKENIDLMESFFKQIKDYNPQIIAREIATHFKNEDNKDDVSVLVIKIEK